MYTVYINKYFINLVYVLFLFILFSVFLVKKIFIINIFILNNKLDFISSICCSTISIFKIKSFNFFDTYKLVSHKHIRKHFSSFELREEKKKISYLFHFISI